MPGVPLPLGFPVEAISVYIKGIHIGGVRPDVVTVVQTYQVFILLNAC